VLFIAMMDSYTDRIHVAKTFLSLLDGIKTLKISALGDVYVGIKYETNVWIN
jgi:hypothetical protein